MIVDKAFNSADVLAIIDGTAETASAPSKNVIRNKALVKAHAFYKKMLVERLANDALRPLSFRDFFERLRTVHDMCHTLAGFQALRSDMTMVMATVNKSEKMQLAWFRECDALIQESMPLVYQLECQAMHFAESSIDRKQHEAEVTQLQARLDETVAELNESRSNMSYLQGSISVYKEMATGSTRGSRANSVAGSPSRGEQFNNLGAFFFSSNPSDDLKKMSGIRSTRKTCLVALYERFTRETDPAVKKDLMHLMIAFCAQYYTKITTIIESCHLAQNLVAELEILMNKHGAHKESIKMPTSEDCNKLKVLERNIRDFFNRYHPDLSVSDNMAEAAMMSDAVQQEPVIVNAL
jgi:hypothetical protein